MKAIDLPKNTVATKWRYDPILSTGDTSSFNSLGSDSYISSVTTTASSHIIADEIQKKLDQMYKEREANIMKMNGTEFKDLEKNLRKLGIELITIRHSAGDVGCEIEGYFNPSVYKKYLDNDAPVGCEINDKPKTLTKTPKIKKDGKWFDLAPKKVKFSGPATIILWEDGTKTVVKCQKEDVWSDEVGIAMCYLKKMLGNQGNFNNIFRQAMKVAEVQTKKEELTSSTAIEGDSYYSSALDSMKRNIDEINDFMKDAADALDKALGGKK